MFTPARNCTRTGCPLTLLLLALVLSAGAVKAQGPPAATQLEINRVEVNSATNQLTITGVNFGSGIPNVTLEGVPLIVIFSTPTMIVAELPADTQPGTYLLKVSQGGGALQKDESDVTIGSVGAPGPAGPQGPQGEPGPAGPQGEIGPAGPQGPQGATGPQGPTGPTGPQGAVGPAGAQGPPGEAGLPGPAGPVGPQGPQGETGPQGPQGVTGPQGPAGPTGATGATGPQGPPGEVGPVGPTGQQGAKGMNWKGLWDSAANYVTDDAVSHDGSSWIAKRANNNVTPVEGDDWTLIAQKGDIGATGPQGSVGPQGPQGATGPQGPPGADGAVGPVGAEGPQGPAGSPGPIGPIQVDTFTMSGTWTMPPGTNRVFVVVVGGGGGGGSTGCSPCGGGGGGGGGYAQKWIRSGLTPTVAITVGEGGLGLSGVPGRAGGTSSFGALLSATGGGGGAFGFSGGAAGTGVNGDLNLTGRAGQDGGMSIVAGGGDTPFGYGFGALPRPKTPGAGNPGVNYGGGGGGCYCSAFDPGGPGTGGVVIIWSYP